MPVILKALANTIKYTNNYIITIRFFLIFFGFICELNSNTFAFDMCVPIGITKIDKFLTKGLASTTNSSNLFVSPFTLLFPAFIWTNLIHYKQPAQNVRIYT